MCQRTFSKILMISFIAFFILWLAGFSQALKIGMAVTREDKVTSPTIERPIVDSSDELKDENILLVLGDSIARGAGDTEKEGFASRLIEPMSNGLDLEINLMNLAIDGLRLDAFMEIIMDDNLIPLIEKSHTMVISIGGNDLRDIARGQSSDLDVAFEGFLEAYDLKMNQALSHVKAINPNVQIIFIGLYPLSENPSDNYFLISFNHWVEKLLIGYDDTVFIPTYDLFQKQLEHRISPDGLHPSSLGHEQIAQRIITSLFNK